MVRTKGLLRPQARVWTTLLMACGLTILTAACGAGGPIAQPSTKTSTSPGAPSSQMPSPLPADRVVFAVTEHPGFTPPIYHVLAAPHVLFYGDGRVVVAEDLETSGPVPPTYRAGTVAAGDLAALVAEAQASGLIDKDADYGEPGVTDLGTTAVLLHGAGESATVGVYAFHANFDDSLPKAQRELREALRALIARFEQLAAGATTTAYRPDRILVRQLTDYDNSKPKPWPGPDLKTFLKTDDSGGVGTACGELTGDSAAQVYAAALDNPGQRWRVDRATRTLVVNALPFDQTC